jgi:Caspase domain
LNAAIVIGADDYGTGVRSLSGAVNDAQTFFDWVVNPSGGNVARDHVRLLLAPRPDGGATLQADLPATKDNIVTAINDLVAASERAGAGPCEYFYFYFAGHGITARVANRDESALVTPGFDKVHPDHSLAVRSLTEFFETTLFRDQFFFLDACRDVPWLDREYEIGRWPIPRRRNPGALPAQQYILYATPPGLTAAEIGGQWPGEANGAFTSVLMTALTGDGAAKAWSWERNCYEVRWERLARYVLARMRERKQATYPAGEPPPDGWPIQIPQDAGSRGVVDRDRDALLASFPRNHFDPLTLEVKLKANPKYDEAEVSVLDTLGDPVASIVKLTGDSHAFTLPPKTYAIRARTTDNRVGRVKAPVDLYEPPKKPEEIALEPPIALAQGQTAEEVSGADDAPSARKGPGTIVVRPADPLTVTELRDEAGTVPPVEGGAVRTGEARFSAPAGFYRARFLGPRAPEDEREAVGMEHFVVLQPGEVEKVTRAKPPTASKRVLELATAAGGEYRKRDRAILLGDDAEPLQWAAPTTIVAVALGQALATRSADPLRRLGVESPLATIEDGQAGVALYAVVGHDHPDGRSARKALERLAARQWEAGDDVPGRRRPLKASDAGVAALVWPVDDTAGPRWLSIEDGDAATVLALPVLPGRIATVIAQVQPGTIRLHQFHPAVAGGPSAAPTRLRRVEHLQRLLLGGQLAGAQQLAEELAASAADDPFAACLAGYVLVRLGARDEGVSKLLGATVSTLTEAAPKLSDGYVLRAEHEAATRNDDAAAQAFADAVSAGIPAFGEGLTRLIEGLRATSYLHPRGALVRHIFQRHARGSMWSAFTPVRPLEPGRLVVSGADLGFEG